MSTMAEHTRNLVEDPRASLLITAAGEGAGRLAVARATLIGTFGPVKDQEKATARYLQIHPGAFWARFPDFSVHRLGIEAIRYVRGFGEMSWVEPGDFATAEADPLAGAEVGIVAHMNDDHADTMVEMVGAFLDVDGEVTDVAMLACDRYGIEVRIGLAPPTADAEPGLAFGRIGFDEVLTDADQAREAMVRLTRAARSGS